MYLYIVYIEWNKQQVPESDALENILSANFKNKKLAEDIYIILSSNSAVEVRNYLVSKINTIDKIFVGELSSSAAWRNLIADSDEIKEMFNHD